jgi:drug/metabolite transporter (DMT)-like permease
LIEIDIHHWPFVRIKRKEDTPSSQAIGWVSLGVMIIAGSTYNIFAKPLTGAFSPLSLLFVSEILTLLFLLCFFGLVPIIRRLFTMKRKLFLPLLWVGILSGTTAPLLWFTGLQATSAINATLFGNAEMVFLIILAVLVLGERWTVHHAIAGITIAMGVLLVALEGFQGEFTVQKGDLFILLASFTFSIGSITFRKYLHHLEPQIAIFMRSVTAITVFLVLAPFLTHSLPEDVRTFPLMLLPALLGFGFIARFLNIFTFYQAIDRLPVSTVSLLGNISVIVGVLFAHWYLGEAILWYHWMGGGFIIFGTVLLETIGIHPSEKHLQHHMEQHHHHRG